MNWQALEGSRISCFWEIGPDCCADLGADYGANGSELAERLGEGGMVT